MTKKTATQKLMERNARAVAKMKRGVAADRELHERVRRGELTAGQAFLMKKSKRFPNGPSQ